MILFNLIMACGAILIFAGLILSFYISLQVFIKHNHKIYLHWCFVTLITMYGSVVAAYNFMIGG